MTRVLSLNIVRVDRVNNTSRNGPPKIEGRPTKIGTYPQKSGVGMFFGGIFMDPKKKIGGPPLIFVIIFFLINDTPKNWMFIQKKITHTSSRLITPAWPGHPSAR